MDFVSIDFETANHCIDSACSLGIVSVKKGKIEFEKEYLINPECLFEPSNILIHHITPDMVLDKPTFPEIWDEIYEIINGRIVFAHAADFDISVLRALLDKYNLKKPDIQIGCTLKLAKIAFKDILPNCKLNTISNYLGIEHNHHNGLSDALVCVHMIKYVERMYQVYDVCDLFNDLSLLFGRFNASEYTKVRSRLKLKTKNVIKDILKGKVVSFTGKPKSLTKNHFMNLVQSYGGVITKDYNHRIDIYVIFQNPSKKDLEKLEKVKEVKNVLVYTEDEFMEIIKNDQ